MPGRPRPRPNCSRSFSWHLASSRTHLTFPDHLSSSLLQPDPHTIDKPSQFSVSDEFRQRSSLSYMSGTATETNTKTVAAATTTKDDGESDYPGKIVLDNQLSYQSLFGYRTPEAPSVSKNHSLSTPRTNKVRYLLSPSASPLPSSPPQTFDTS